MRIINLFIIVAFLFLCLSEVQAQKRETKYSIGIDTMYLQQCHIKDSLLSSVIDSAIAMFRLDIIEGYDMPYAYRIKSEKHGPNTYIKVFANSEFTIVYNEEEREMIYDGPFLMHKGRQILVDTSDKAILDYIRLDKSQGAFYRYFLYKGDISQAFYYRKRGVKQSVSFYIDEKNRCFYLSKYDLLNLGTFR
ncbi:MAG: hypothetical protein BGO09_09390 [Bacteroidetes bacterium 47-18]|nr:MAG: hypothetical protein BGO09_09390 [Bacteroidetes bacterium 47-18]